MKGTWAWGLLLASVIAVLAWMWRPSHTATLLPLESAHKAANAATLRASRLALPKELEGVYLGMDLNTLRKARPRLRLNTKTGETEHLVYDETLQGSSRAMYFVRRGDFLLEKVQVGTVLSGPDAIQERVRAHAQRYGAATGIWDCPDRGADYLATRRFSWQVEGIGLMDVYLIVGENVSATLYAAPGGVIMESLRAAGCIPTQGDGLTQFPVPGRSVPRAQ